MLMLRPAGILFVNCTQRDARTAKMVVCLSAAGCVRFASACHHSSCSLLVSSLTWLQQVVPIGFTYWLSQCFLLLPLR